MILYLIFLLSGFSGMVYEQIAFRLIGSKLGFTALNESVVLVIFFCGLGMGYFMGNTRLFLNRKSLLIYGILEVAVGIYAFCIPSIMNLESFGTGEMGMSLLRSVSIFVYFSLSVFLGLSLPTFIFATTSTLTEKLPEEKSYAVNTVGAAAGLVVFTTVLVSSFGVERTNTIASAISVGCGVVAIGIYMLISSGKKISTLREYERQSILSCFATEDLIAVVIGGAFVGAYEVLSIRYFSLVLHNSSYSFAIVLLVVLIGLSAGAFVSGKKWNLKLEYNVRFFAFSSIAALGMLFFIVTTRLNYLDVNDSLFLYLGKASVFAIVSLFGSCFVLGTILPTAWLRWRSNSANMGAITSLSALSTMSAAIGSAFVGLVLLSTMGVRDATSFVFGGGIVVAFMFVSLRRKWKRSDGYWLLVSSAVVSLLVVVALNFDGVPENNRLIYKGESAYGRVDVLEEKEGNKKLRQNIHYTMGGSSSRKMELRQGVIPLLLHNNPQSVLFIGMGTGITASSSVLFNVPSIDVVELIPDVAKAAEYFSEENRGLLTNSKVNLHLDDGRSFLRKSLNYSFDVVVADLFVPWESKAGYLYTKDFYELVRSSLSDNGLFFQWIALWQVTEKQFKIIGNSIAKVFPHVSLFWGRIQNDKALIGFMASNERKSVEVTNVKARLDSVASLRNDVYFDTPIPLNDLYIGDWEGDDVSAINTDDLPILEFLAPKDSPTMRNRLVFSRLKRFHSKYFMDLSRVNIRFDQPGATWDQLDLIAKRWQSRMINMTMK